MSARCEDGNEIRARGLDETKTTIMTKSAVRHITRRAAGASLAGALFVTLFSAPLPAHAGAVGVSPISLSYNEALRGSSQVQTLLLSNEPSSGDSGTLAFSMKAQGEVAPWVSFLPLGDDRPRDVFQVVERETEAIRVVVKVPVDTPNRSYSGTLFIEAARTNAVVKPGSAGVGTAAEIPVTVSVNGVERRGSVVRDFLVEEAEVGLKQRFTAKITNTGNVSVAAQLDTTILRGGAEVATLTTKDQNFPVFPGVDGDVTIDWDTAEQLGGDYIAKLTVSDVSGIKPAVIGTKTVPFRLEPRGTFTRSGEFTDFILLNPPAKGELLVAEATFLNSGKIPTQAILDSDILLNGKLIKNVQSLPRTVRPGQTGRITVSIDSLLEGKYTIKGRINYDGEVSDDRELAFEVGGSGASAAGPTAGPTVAATSSSSSSSSSSSTSSVPFIAGGGAAVIGAAGAAFLVGRRKQAKGSAPK
jgi:hypothetical protein